MGPIRQGRGGIAPGPAAVGGSRPDLRRAVKYLRRAVSLRRAGQRQRYCRGDAITDGAGVGRERADARCHGAVVSIVTPVPPRPHRYCQPHRSPWPSGCAWHSTMPRWYKSRRRCRWPPRAQQRRAVKHLDCAVGLRRTGQRKRIVVGDAVADRALSVENEPMVGAAGATVSIVTDNGVDGLLVPPVLPVSACMDVAPG